MLFWQELKTKTYRGEKQKTIMHFSYHPVYAFLVVCDYITRLGGNRFRKDKRSLASFKYAGTILNKGRQYNVS